MLNLHPHEEAWTAPPLAQVGISLGENLVPADTTVDPPKPAVVFPTLGEFMADPEFAAAYNPLGSKIYTKLIELVPILKGSQPA